ncbi:uncharacterized protein LOC123537150 [Mercenaria mercenaria]|uniref:uncharacterized protein LOC123537150 n=1 Tax=Mercenaria mercenaria TaxID=6596 RepID=UPI00234F73AC|nr:uncharacterized protein LOC123537150 [Mercenaria mercenaria]
MKRLPDSRPGNGKCGDNTTDNLGPIKGPNDLGRPSKLQPIKPNRSTRLPPLKSHRLSDKQTAQSSGIVSTQPSKLEFQHLQTEQIHPLFSRETAKPKQSDPVKTYRLPNNEITSDRNTPVSIDRPIVSDIQTGKPNDELASKNSIVKHNDNRYLVEVKPRPPRFLKNPTTKLKPTCQINQTRAEKGVTWQKERELLRKHRKQQAEWMNISTKPVKATKTFDRYGKESKMQFPELETADKNPKISERQNIDLSVRRKCDDDEEWDWDKDIEEYTKLEQKEITRQHPTSGACSPSQNGGHRQQTAVILNCTKKGVGFKSKKRIEEEKQQEQANVEKERKEKEHIEMMIPQKIRNNLKKYGFR